MFAQYGLHICTGVVEFYTNRFPNINTTTGKLDLFPSQVIESYWCGSGSMADTAWGHGNGQNFSRGECVTNGTPDIAGLRAVLSRLVSLPSAMVAGDARAEWGRVLALLPGIPTHVCTWGQ